MPRKCSTASEMGIKEAPVMSGHMPKRGHVWTGKEVTLGCGRLLRMGTRPQYCRATLDDNSNELGSIARQEARAARWVRGPAASSDYRARLNFSSRGTFPPPLGLGSIGP